MMSNDGFGWLEKINTLNVYVRCNNGAARPAFIRVKYTQSEEGFAAIERIPRNTCNKVLQVAIFTTSCYKIAPAEEQVFLSWYTLKKKK